MGRLDEKKEYIGILKAYMNIIVAFILAIGAGISKMYLSNNTSLLFWIGVLFILALMIIFTFIAKKAHKEIIILKNLKD